MIGALYLVEFLSTDIIKGKKIHHCKTNNIPLSAQNHYNKIILVGKIQFNGWIIVSSAQTKCVVFEYTIERLQRKWPEREITRQIIPILVVH